MVSQRWRAKVSAAAVPVLPAVVLLVLGIAQLSQHLPLWYDESYTSLAVHVSVRQLLSSLWHHTGLVTWLSVPPSFNAPYYVVMHLWCAVFGTSALALRLPSLICAAIAVGLVASTVRNLTAPMPGLVAGMVCATGPLLAQEAVEARSYGAAMLATSLTIWLLVRRARGVTRRVWPVGVAGAAAALLHWFTLPVLVCVAVADLVARRRDAIAEIAALAAGLVPALALVALSLTGDSTGAPSPSRQGLRLPWRSLHDWALGSLPLASTLLALLILALLRSPYRLLLLSWVVAPVLLITLIDLRRPVYFPRYMLFALLGLGAAAGLAVASVRRFGARVAVGLVLVAVSTVAVVPAMNRTPRERPDAVVRFLIAHHRAGQPVVPVDGRAAVEVVEAVEDDAPSLSADLRLRPVRVPVEGDAHDAWLIRSGRNGSFEIDINDEWNLYVGHWSLQSQTVFHGTAGDLRLEYYTR